MEVKLLLNSTISGVPYAAGDTISVTPSVRDELVSRGAVAPEVVQVVAEPEAPVLAAPEPRTRFFSGKKKG